MKELPKLGDEVREFINTTTSGTYAGPVQKMEMSKAFCSGYFAAMSNLRAFSFEATTQEMDSADLGDALEKHYQEVCGYTVAYCSTDYIPPGDRS